MKKVLIIILSICLILVIIEALTPNFNFGDFLNTSKTEKHNPEIGNTSNLSTEDIDHQIQNELNKNISGKDNFTQQCSACHAIDKKIIGPKLRGVDYMTFNNWTNNEVFYKTNISKSGYSMLSVHYNITNSMSEDEINSIYEYLKQ